MTNSNRIKLTWISFLSYALTGALVIVTGMVMGNIADYFNLPVSSMSNTFTFLNAGILISMNRPGFPGECFICELRLPDHRFRWKHNKLFLLLPEEYGPAFPAIVDCYTSPPTLVWPVPLLHGFSSSYGVLPPLCKDH